jgi:hypothetical protein
MTAVSVDLTPSRAVTLAPVVDLETDAIAGTSGPCANCLHPLTGEFCARCGAPALEHRPLTVRRFAGDLWNEVTNFDSSTMRTVRALLTSPGTLTSDYLAGRTRWYMSPMRLLLLATAFSLVVRAQLGINERMQVAVEQGFEGGRTGASAHGAAAPEVIATRTGAYGAAAAAMRPQSLRKRRAERQMNELMASAPKLMMMASTNQWFRLLDPLVLAWALMRIFRRKRRGYAEHVVHSMHLLAFVAALSLVSFPLMVLDGSELRFWSLPAALNAIVLARYAYLSARRVHGDGTARTVVDSLLMLVAMEAATMLSAGIALVGMLLLGTARIVLTMLLS